MRILLTSPIYPPLNSGLGNAVFIQATSLVKAGHEVTVATGGQRNSELVEGVTVETFCITGANCLFQPIHGEVDVYLDFLRQGNWDVILINGWQNWATDLLLRSSTKISGRKILYSHGISTNSFFLNQPLKSCLRYLSWRPYWWGLGSYIKKLDGMIFLASNGLAPRFDDLSIAKNSKVPISVIPNSLSKFALESLAEPHASQNSRNCLIAVGSYQWQKGFDFVIRAFAASLVYNRFTLHLYGQEYSSYCASLRDLMKRLELPEKSVVFHQKVSGKDLLFEYRRARLVLSGSHSECQPLALIDANASGVPFISRNSGCIQFMPGGTVVSTFQEMANQINMLVNEPLKWQNFSDAGRRAAYELYQPDRNVQKLLDVIGE